MLDEIIQHQRTTYKMAPIQDLSLVPKSQRDFKQALRAKPYSLILECKQASPSKGLIAKDYDPIRLAQNYLPFASAISVLVNEPFFSGSLDDLRRVSDAVTCPVLAKDIVVSHEQIIEARRHGADAVLLMLCVLKDEEYLALKTTAKALHMDVITEIHQEEELARALNLEADILGINHRDFKTMQVDLSVTARLAPLIPSDKLVIGESGISRYSDLKALRPNVDAFLIGSHLSGALRPDLALRQLLFNRIKLCGLTQARDAQHAYDLGASYGGLIFTSHSPRCVTLNQAKELIHVPLHWVGVFQDEDPDTVCHYAHQLNLKAVQCHGHESKAYLQRLRQRLPHTIEIWKATSLATLSDYDIPEVNALVLDHQTKSQLGGTGIRVPLEPNQSRLEDLGVDTTPVMLAGGLGPDCIQEVLFYDFAGFDINSGVEQSPGIKCPHKLKQLFQSILEK